MKGKKAWYYLVIILVGALIGAVLGEVLGTVMPEGVVSEFFLKSAAAALEPATLDLIIIKLTIGFSFKLNLMGIIGILITGYALRWVE